MSMLVLVISMTGIKRALLQRTIELKRLVYKIVGVFLKTYFTVGRFEYLYGEIVDSLFSLHLCVLFLRFSSKGFINDFSTYSSVFRI